jgi:hypothetical protein
MTTPSEKHARLASFYSTNATILERYNSGGDVKRPENLHAAHELIIASGGPHQKSPGCPIHP